MKKHCHIDRYCNNPGFLYGKVNHFKDIVTSHKHQVDLKNNKKKTGQIQPAISFSQRTAIILTGNST